MKKIPYFKQQNDYFCGPAVAQMAIGFFMKPPSQNVLAKRMGTTSRTGTSHAALERVIRGAGLRGVETSRVTIAELRRSLSVGNPVIVNYREPEENISHYAVVIAITAFHIFLNDPWHGASFRLSLKWFLPRWVNANHRSVHWMMVVSKEGAK
jgi:predicted double-glycine peptidase